MEMQKKEILKLLSNHLVDAVDYDFIYSYTYNHWMIKEK